MNVLATISLLPPLLKNPLLVKKFGTYFLFPGLIGMRLPMLQRLMNTGYGARMNSNNGWVTTSTTTKLTSYS